MAVVRITPQIRQHVINKINELFAKRIKAEHDKLQHLDVGMQVFMSRIDKEAFDLAVKLNALNIKWVPEISSITVTIAYTDTNGLQKAYTFTVPFKPPIPAPSFMQGYQIEIAKNKVLPSMACYAPCVEALKAADAVVAERDTLINTISKLLQQCSTLRQVLDAWPTAMDYMPDEVRQRHAAKSAEKRKTEIDEVSEEAKILLMKARMINGS